LDDSSPLNGCVQVIPGSHRNGVVNKAHHSSFLTDEQVGEHCPAAKTVNLELVAGQVALLHNWTLHRSGTNQSKDMARRAFSVNYMDGRTQLGMISCPPPCVPPRPICSPFGRTRSTAWSPRKFTLFWSSLRPDCSKPGQAPGAHGGEQDNRVCRGQQLLSPGIPGCRVSPIWHTPSWRLWWAVFLWPSPLLL
jgi:hypothetical protein